MQGFCAQAEAGEHARRRLALAEAALADLQKSLTAAQAEKQAVDLAVQRERERRGHPQTVRSDPSLRCLPVGCSPQVDLASPALAVLELQWSS